MMFFQNYVDRGGRLLIEGTATNDFYGKDISDEWKKIAAKSVATSFSLDNIEKLGIPKNELVDGVANEAGAFTFTNVESIQSNIPATFSFDWHGNTFSGTYKGLAAIKVDAAGNLQKLAATSFGSIKKNGKEMLHMSKEADVFISIENKTMNAIIADDTKSARITQNK